MRNFDVAYKALMVFENGYANDPDDAGGETWKGIARNFNPNWPGWVIINEYKRKPKFPANLLDSVELEELVQSFYKNKFWNVFKCDSLPYPIAEEIFEISVNMGIQQATKLIQRTCNLLNRNQKLYSDILVDGKFGLQTGATLERCIEVNSEKTVLNVLNILQGCFYVSLMEQKPVYEKYIGWFNRIEIRK